MYLTDDYYERDDAYMEDGRKWLFEVWDDHVWITRDYEDLGKVGDFTEAFREFTAARTGRADEIGDVAYMEEVGAAQREARRQEFYENVWGQSKNE